MQQLTFHGEQTMQKIRWIDQPVESVAPDGDLALTEGDHRGSPLPGVIRQYQPYPIFLAEG